MTGEGGQCRRAPQPLTKPPAEGYKSTDCLKGRLSLDVEVVSLADIRRLLDLNEHELSQHLAEEPPRRRA